MVAVNIVLAALYLHKKNLTNLKQTTQKAFLDDNGDGRHVGFVEANIEEVDGITVSKIVLQYLSYFDGSYSFRFFDRNNNKILVIVDFGPNESFLSMKSTNIKSDKSKREQNFKSIQAQSLSSTLKKDELYTIAFITKLSKTPEDSCNSICQEKYAYIERYTDKNTSFFLKPESGATIGGVYEIETSSNISNP